MNGVTQVSEHTFEIGGMSAAAPQPDFAPQPSAPHVQAQPPKRVVQTATPGITTDVRSFMRQLKARRQEVKRGLRTKLALERELEQLNRLIRAASTELDNVRRLRAAG